MISPVWVEFNGLDDRPVYLCAGSATTVEPTPEGSRIRADGAWTYVTDDPLAVLDKMVKASEFSTEAVLWMVKGIVDGITGEDEKVN